MPDCVSNPMFLLQVLHSGEGPIHAIKWRGSLVAWANNLGVKLYDTSTQQRLSFIERPPASPRPELVRPHIVWQVGAIPQLVNRLWWLIPLSAHSLLDFIRCC